MIEIGGNFPLCLAENYNENKYMGEVSSIDVRQVNFVVEIDGQEYAYEEIVQNAALQEQFLAIYNSDSHYADDPNLKQLSSTVSEQIQRRAQAFASSGKKHLKIEFTKERAPVFVAGKNQEGEMVVVTVTPEERRDAPGRTEEEKAVYVAQQRFNPPDTVVAEASPAPVVTEEVAMVTQEVPVVPEVDVNVAVAGAQVVFEEGIIVTAEMADVISESGTLRVVRTE